MPREDSTLRRGAGGSRVVERRLQPARDINGRRVRPTACLTRTNCASARERRRCRWSLILRPSTCSSCASCFRGRTPSHRKCSRSGCRSRSRWHLPSTSACACCRSVRMRDSSRLPAGTSCLAVAVAALTTAVAWASGRPSAGLSPHRWHSHRRARAPARSIEGSLESQTHSTSTGRNGRAESDRDAKRASA
jgi:hypothetical protein